MSKEEFEKIVDFIQGYYSRKLDKNELIALKDELKQLTYQQFTREVKDILIEEVEYFSVANLHKVIKNKKIEESVSNINWNSSYWYEIDREICERDNIPYYDITKGIDVPLAPYKN